MRHRYFIDVNGPLFKAAKLVLEQRRKAGSAILAFAKEVGASQVYGYSPESYLFDFKSSKDADPTTWSKTKPRRGTYYFRPRGNSPEGKAMAARIKLLPPCPKLDSALEVVEGLTVGFPIVIEGHTGYCPFIRHFSLKDPKIVVASVPWKDVDPKELAAYKKQAASKSRISWSAAMDFAQWEPPTWLREIKEWEAQRLIEEGVIPGGGQ